MAYQAIAVRQVKSETKASPQTDTITITPASAVAAGSIAENVAAGTPTITATFNRNGYNSVTWALFEIEKCVTSSGADKGHSDMVN